MFLGPYSLQNSSQFHACNKPRKSHLYFLPSSWVRSQFTVCLVLISTIYKKHLSETIKIYQKILNLLRSESCWYKVNIGEWHVLHTNVKSEEVAVFFKFCDLTCLRTAVICFLPCNKYSLYSVDIIFNL